MPRYTHEPAIVDAREPRIGVLLTNLGTPDAPTPAAVRRYLREFLFDPRVVEKPRWLWWLILNGVILRVRPRKVAKAYHSVWTDEGAPLLAIARRQARALQDVLHESLGNSVSVELAMRYGSPSIANGLKALKERGCNRLIVLPLYPQYSATTTGSTFDAVADVLKTWRWIPEVHMINNYHHEPEYIRLLAESITGFQQGETAPDKLMMSFHGLPKSYVEAGDPYQAQCQHTAHLLAEELGLEADRWRMTYQSRFGPEEWLQPYTDKTLEAWGKEGIKSVDVVCPGFSADCLETLEEVSEQNRDIFLGAGGERYRYIPCLNDDEGHIRFLADLVERQCQGWD